MTQTPSTYGVPAPGHRLPPSTAVGRVRLQVADLERSLAYYTQLLGLRVISTTTGSVALGPANEERTIVELHERAGAHPVPRRGLLGLYHFAILLPERRDLGRFVDHAARHHLHMGSADHAVSEAVYLTDPDGLGIEVYADRPRSAWRLNGQEIYMTTEPLDLTGLVRAAGDTRWTGMPAGTRIGHVHLYVGDLDRAAAFYHAALGLDKVVWSYPGALFLSAGGYHHHLGTNTWAAGARPASERDARLLDWELVVPDAAALADAERSITSAGHTTTPDGADRLATDPWGTALRLRAASI